MKQKKANHSRFLRAIVYILIAVFTLICSIVFRRLTPKDTAKQLQNFADSVYELCSKEGYTPSCYDREIPKLMKFISMENAFEVTRLIQKKDPHYLYCHVLGHKLSYQEAAKDVSKWKDVVTRCPTTFCNNGCQHGALMRRFNAEHLTDAQITQALPDLMDVCEPRGSWNPTEVERSMCYHGLGHLTMYIANANIPKALSLCEKISKKADGRMYYITCSQGVFMTVFQPLEPEDFALIKDIKPAKEQVDQFCAPYSGEAWLSCHSESWAMFIEEIKKPEGLIHFCSYATDEVGHNKCISTAMNFLTVNFVIDQNDSLDELETYCNSLPEQMKGQCFADSAFRLVQIDPRYTGLAVSVCGLAQKAGVGDVCYPYLLQHVTHSFHPGSVQAIEFCEAFPGNWKEKCLKADK